MKTLIAGIVILFLSGCASDGSFQWPSFMFQDKVSGKLIGCLPDPATNTQRCDYEDDKRKWSLVFPLEMKVPTLASPDTAPLE